MRRGRSRGTGNLCGFCRSLGFGRSLRLLLCQFGVLFRDHPGDVGGMFL